MEKSDAPVNWLVLGSTGMLGSEFARLGAARAWSRQDFDLNDSASIRGKVLALDVKPSAIVNCVAYNNVDGAEDDAATAFKVNADFPGELAAIAAVAGIPFVHFSTDYVFDGERGAYHEDDQPNPISVYGRSKLEGEKKVLEFPNAYCIRTARLFGKSGTGEHVKKSFFEVILERAKSQSLPAQVKAVRDEVGSMCYVPDLARATIELLGSGEEPGIYHLVNMGSASWYDSAVELFRLAGGGVTVLPVDGSEFPRKAKRPKNSTLINTKVPEMRSWQLALAEFLNNPGAAG